MSARVHHARLRASRTIARDTVEYVFSHDEELSFRPGQFISVQVSIDEERNPVLRSYSLASSPERKGELLLVLRLVKGGPGSAFFAALSPGDPIRFTGPMGFFVNELIHTGDAVYAATGTGIAPIVPMVTEVLSRPETGKVLLYWGLRDEQDEFWQDELRGLVARHREHGRLSCHVYLSRPGPAYSGLRGRITAPILEALPGLCKPIFYLCGNGQMIDELKSALVARGVDRRRQVRTEAFFD